MQVQSPKLIKRLRWGGSLVLTGLLIQLASFYWNHPLSFIAFALVGSLLSAIGSVVYLFAIVSSTDWAREDEAYSSQKARMFGDPK
jgi:hypothetical protein